MDEITTDQITAALSEVPPADVPAVRLLMEVQALGTGEGIPSIEWLLEHQARLETAMKGLTEQVQAARGMVERCQLLRPRPSRFVPPGI